MPARHGETQRHRELKRRAVVWALAHGFRACGLEVRVPRSAFRADVAACMVTNRRHANPGESALFECKQVRSDLLRDSADEVATLARLREVSERRRHLEQLLGLHLPNLRRGDSLFPECDDYDFDSIRHEGLRSVRREEEALQAKVFGGTKFARLCRYHCADRLYLVVAENVMRAHEAPAGWGVLAARGDGLELIRPPTRLNPDVSARLALLEAIAVAGTRNSLADLAIAGDALAVRRAENVSP